MNDSLSPLFTEVNPEDLQDNFFRAIGREWMLITAQKDGQVNTMTASWGLAGILWNKPVAVCFVRPQRYTHAFTEASDFLTLSFFTPEYRDALSFCGRKSGRDCNKFKETGLTPLVDRDYAFPAEARMVFLCRKLYVDTIEKSGFTDPSILKNYPIDDFHTVYVCQIEKVLLRR